MKLRFEVLPKAQKDIYSHLKAVKDLGFTLFGGVALALQIGNKKISFSLLLNSLCYNNTSNSKQRRKNGKR